MTKLPKLTHLPVLMGLILMCLISCDDQGTTSATASNTSTATTDTQQYPKFDSFQSPSEIDQLKVRLFDNPEDFNALSALGDLYFESGQYVEAIQTYDKALGVNPTCADCLNDKGLALFYTGDSASALQSFDKAIEIAPEFPNVWLSKGFVLVSEGRYEEAIVPLNTVKELDTTGRLSLAADQFLAQATQGIPQ